MNIHVQPKKISALLPTDIFFQTPSWSRVKSQLGWKPAAFDFTSSAGQRGDLLVLLKSFGHGLTVAYVPQGPESEPDPEKYGAFLEELSHALIGHLDPTVTFIRYDLPWESPYAADTLNGQHWSGHPAARLRELRMNIGTRTWNLRKTSLDPTVADVVMIDLAHSESDIFAAMKPKTRYNIRLAQRKEVRVFPATTDMLPVFYELYLQTANRNGFPAGTYQHFSTLFKNPGSSDILFLLAARGEDVLAGAIIAIAGRRALYLFGASSGERRNLMGSYALQWEVMKLVRNKGCLTYDMGAVAPVPNPDHPFYGMYRFKSGFGGQIVHRNGSWDYPLDMEAYEVFRNFESLNQLTPSQWNT
ncbi:MAG TPA: peptidoglycan bridge formation glycyltransferase FemA/FemB family protein [Syntrophales bacterium]|jgi:lipid II:glycine glycyltransferase (peptidoglycan interpeptide bridge formation enzyme)|nr:peptidoglycan bridge formation glycyltransferase FemA/FemB family protein [Syntrophales bacterium]HPX55215.1 peptidoglycan bridge formation glycyltransferase FemA/FemB family protein [Syntrophales bacterium]